MIWIILIILGLFVSFCLLSISSLFWIAVGLFFFLLVVWVAKGFHNVQQDERVLIERNGAYRRFACPGLRWWVPGTDQKRTSAYTCEFVLDLVTPERKMGGVVVKGAKAFVKILSPYNVAYETGSVAEGDLVNANSVYRSVYCVANWKKATIALLSDALEQAQFPAGLANGTPTAVRNISPEAAVMMRCWGLIGQITVDLQPNP